MAYIVSEADIETLGQNIKPGWYMHFWKEKNIIAVFPGKRFAFVSDNPLSRIPAIEYGISLGIPREQLDFPIQ